MHSEGQESAKLLAAALFELETFHRVTDLHEVLKEFLAGILGKHHKTGTNK